MSKGAEILEYISNYKAKEGVFAGTLPTLPWGNYTERKIMVVGQNPGGKGRKHYPIIWKGSANAEFFMDCVEKAGIKLDCWYTNLCPYPTKDNLLSVDQFNETKHIIQMELDLLRPNVVITLGRTVDEYFHYLKYEGQVINVYHPSYMNRFHKKNNEILADYIDRLRQARQFL